MNKFRIKQEIYKSGYNKHYPQIYLNGDQKILSFKAMGFNNNGYDWCETIDDAKNLINSFNKIMLSNGPDNIVDEIIHEI